MSVDLDTIRNQFGKKWSNAVMQDVAIAGAVPAGVYSDKLPIGGKKELGIWVKCAGSSVDVDVVIEFSPTETDTDFSELEGGSTQFSGLSDILPHNDIMIRKPSNWMRVKVIGNAGNGADTTITVVINHTYQGK